MKHFILFSIMLMLFTLTSCEAIGDIFSAGFYTGLTVVLVVIILIIWLVSRGRRG
jgi:TRAP-type C4-dicarboxylate transport system permease large subunit